MNPLHFPSLELCKKLTEAGFPRTQMEYAEVYADEFIIMNTDDESYTITKNERWSGRYFIC